MRYYFNNKYLIRRYGLLKRLKRGVRLKIFPTFKCSLNCWYCGNKVEGKVRPNDKNLNFQYSLADWKYLIKNFPVKVREVVISGGEPTLWNDFIPLCKWILDQGLMLSIFTNLTNDLVKYIPESPKVRIYATFHGRIYPKQKFMKNYGIASQYHRIDVNEIAEKKLSFSKVDNWGCSLKQGYVIDKNYFWIAPNGAIHPHCVGVMMQGQTKEEIERMDLGKNND